MFMTMEAIANVAWVMLGAVQDVQAGRFKLSVVSHLDMPVKVLR